MGRPTLQEAWECLSHNTTAAAMGKLKNRAAELKESWDSPSPGWTSHFTGRKTGSQRGTVVQVTYLWRMHLVILHPFLWVPLLTGPVQDACWPVKEPHSPGVTTSAS
jgi:hypothetical protein